MKYNYKHKILLLTLVLASYLGIAQTVNTGGLYVTPGTIMSTVSNFDNTDMGAFINDGDVYVYANWNNDGIVDFLGNTGLTRFIGDNIQIISGDKFSYLYDALFDNNSAQFAFNLSGAISVANESDFEMGIVDNDNFGGTFQFEINANHNYTSDDSHVDGRVIKVGDDDFTYPIGDGGYYRLAGISSPDTENDVFTGKYFLEDTNTNYPVTNLGPDLILVDNTEHWIIERTQADADVLVTLSWNVDTTPSEIIEEPYDAIHIARWDPVQQLWLDEGGAVDVDNRTVTAAVDDYGVFTLARVKSATVLPCALTVYNLLTPNDDGINDVFEIKQAVNDNECAQNMTVKIFDRWGIEVFEANNYNQGNNQFTGYSDGRMTIARDKGLPTGTYFYILTFDYEDNNTTRKYKKAGYLYINGQ